jgi:hypothetical protein
MAKEDNNALPNVPPNVPPSLLKAWAEIKNTIPDNRADRKGDGELEIKIEIKGRTARGGLEVEAHIPYELMDNFLALAAGKRVGRWECRLHLNSDRTVRARMGEFEPLIRHLEDGGKLTDKERRTLAMIARGALPRMGRPPETKTEVRNRDIVRFAQILKVQGGKRVVDITAAKFGIDRSYVPKLIKKYRDEGWGPMLFGYLLAALGADQETIRRAVRASAGISEDDFRDAIGRKKKLRK